MNLINFARDRLSGVRYSAAELRQQQRAFSAKYDTLVTLSSSFIETARIDLKSDNEGDVDEDTESG